MPMKKGPPENTDKINAACAEALAGGDKGSASQTLLATLKRRPSLWQEFSDLWMLYACDHAIHEYLSTVNRKRLNEMLSGKAAREAEQQNGPTPQLPRAVRREQQIKEEGFLYVHLPIKGRPLMKDATEKQLQQAAAFWKVRVREASGKFEYYDACAKQRARGELTEAFLQRTARRIGIKTAQQLEDEIGTTVEDRIEA